MDNHEQQNSKQHRDEERITTQTPMKSALYEEWTQIIVQAIDKEVAKLPIIMARCIAVNGSSHNLHA